METFKIRPATLADAAELLRIRYDAIMGVRIAGVAQEHLRRRAERRDIRWMVHAIPDRETWAAIVDDRSLSAQGRRMARNRCGKQSRGLAAMHDVGRTAWRSARGPGRSEGHVSCNGLVRQHAPG